MRQKIKNIRIGTPMFSAIVGRMERNQPFNDDGVDYAVTDYKQIDANYFRFTLTEV